MSEPQSNTRRLLLERSAVLVGGLLVAPAFLNAKEKERRLGASASNVFTAPQRELLRSLCDTILPETESAGALAAHVDDFISDTLELWCTPTERRRFLGDLDSFEQDCRSSLGRSFTSLSAADRLAYLEPLDRAAIEARQRRIDPLPFFATLKELTLIGYYTSEVGCRAIGYLGPVGTSPGRDGPINSPVWI